MNKKIWASLLVALFVLCPVALVCISSESSSTTPMGETVYDPDDGNGGTTPDSVGGNDPEHPQ
jgi:hypothetical protein